MRLSKAQVLAYLLSVGVDASKKPRMSTVDQSSNVFSPEQYCYKVQFTCLLTGERRRLAVYPHTIGYQGY